VVYFLELDFQSVDKGVEKLVCNTETPVASVQVFAHILVVWVE
jgi:hypothetical protein